MNVEKEEIRVVNPAKYDDVRTFLSHSATDLQKMYKKAEKAQQTWRASKLSERKRILKMFRQLLKENIQRLAKDLTRDMGKPLQQAENEIAGTLKRVDFFISHFEKNLKDEKISTKEIIKYEPLGVIANISAWNYPYFVGTNVFVPAILTGNTVLYKPSELTIKTGKNIEALFKKAGLPAGVFQTIIGDGKVGSALLDLPIDGVFFTGSYATGARINEKVAKKMIRVQMELGGKDPTYVADDADPVQAAKSLADGAFYNAGQSCCSVERIYVHKKVAKEFIDAFVDEVKTFKVGPPHQKDVYLGPLARRDQLTVLEDQIEDAKFKGARVLLGGGRAKQTPGFEGNYFQPTVLTEVTSSMKVMREESFGPLIGIQVVKSDKEAIEKMNDTEYGLTAGVYSKSKTRAEEILSEVNSGSAYWNCCDRVNPVLPWSGRKHSGIGSTLSDIGIRSFVQPKAFHL